MVPLPHGAARAQPPRRRRHRAGAGAGARGAARRARGACGGGARRAGCAPRRRGRRGVEGPFSLTLDGALEVSWAAGELVLRFLDAVPGAQQGLGAGRTERRVPFEHLDNLRVLVDSSAVEVFANDGARALATRWFPVADVSPCHAPAPARTPLPTPWATACRAPTPRPRGGSSSSVVHASADAAHAKAFACSGAHMSLCACAEGPRDDGCGALPVRSMPILRSIPPCRPCRTCLGRARSSAWPRSCGRTARRAPSRASRPRGGSCRG